MGLECGTGSENSEMENFMRSGLKRFSRVPTIQKRIMQSSTLHSNSEGNPDLFSRQLIDHNKGPVDN